MNSENICISSKTIDIAETETYIELTNRVCYYDAPNLNNVELISEDALDKAQTLVNMPVVAKYRVNGNGEPSFGGHEVYVDSDGDIQFGTDNIGTHTEVYIQEDTVDVKGIQKTLPCLFAKYRIWKRNKNVIAAVQRLYSEGKLYSSWELATLAYTFKNGIKTLSDYLFLSNCLLGYETAYPAYGVDAKAISMSQYSPELLIAEAFAKDKLESEDENLTKKLEKEISTEVVEETTEIQVETDEVVNEETTVSEEVEEEVNEEPTVVEETATEEETEEVEEPETSALTDYDIRYKLTAACREVLDRWCWVAFVFPEDHVCWVEYDGRESELDYKLFSYTVTNNDITISEPTDVKLSVGVAQINDTVSELNNKINTLNESLVDASSVIQNLNTQISELKIYKDKFEESEQEKLTAELNEKRIGLKNLAVKSGLFTEEELETSEDIRTLIENVDEVGIKTIIAERFVKSLDNIKEPEVEVSTVNPTEIGKVNITSADNDRVIEPKSAMKMYLKK